MEYIEYETAPSDESCVQVNSNEDYMPAMRKEAERFRAMLERRFPNAPGYWSIKSCPHDFGSYLEMRYNYDEDEEGLEWMSFIDNNFPRTWDDDRVFLETKRPKGILQQIAEDNLLC